MIVFCGDWGGNDNDSESAEDIIIPAELLKLQRPQLTRVCMLARLIFLTFLRKVLKTGSNGGTNTQRINTASIKFVRTPITAKL